MNERLKYSYEDDGKVADVEVFDANGKLIRRMKYSYDGQGDVNKISFILPDVDTWDFVFDYGSERLKWSTFSRDTIEFLRTEQIDPLFHNIGWSDPGNFHYFWESDSAGNISDIIYPDTRLILSYDTGKNPLHGLTSTRVLSPLGMTLNNVTRIESRFIGPGFGGSVIWRYIADITYAYDEKGRPMSALRSYQCGPADTLTYAYDIVDYSPVRQH